MAISSKPDPRQIKAEIRDEALTLGFDAVGFAPADRAIAGYFRSRRYAGSKDRGSVAELVYGVPSSTAEPEIYSFAHGGKDGHPYPVDRKTYDETVEFLSTALKRARIGEMVNMVKRSRSSASEM